MRAPLGLLAVVVAASSPALSGCVCSALYGPDRSLLNEDAGARPDGAVDATADAGCVAPQVQCGPVCVNVLANRSHCGECNHACEAGQLCVDGECAEDCGDLVDCDGECVDTDTDARHCGECGRVCGGDAVCEGGLCLCGKVECGENEECIEGVCECEVGLVDCDGECVDLSSDPAHCGGCGHYCPVVCVSGLCDCGDFASCPDGGGGVVCVDTDLDPRNCGGCGTTCPSAEYCKDGTCACRPGFTRCSGTCRNLLMYPDDCGGCADRCNDPNRCNRGECVGECDEGLTACDRSGDGDIDFCSDLNVDPVNCGACRDASCDSYEVCIAGVCEGWTVALGCDACPCDACTDTGTLCCPYPGDAEVTICVEAEACPVAG